MHYLSFNSEEQALMSSNKYKIAVHGPLAEYIAYIVYGLWLNLKIYLICYCLQIVKKMIYVCKYSACALLVKFLVVL